MHCWTGATAHPAAEDYIGRKFSSRCGAHLQEFMPCILAVNCAGNLAAGLAPTLEKPVSRTIPRGPHLRGHWGAIRTGNPATTDHGNWGNRGATSNGAILAKFILLASALHRTRFQVLTFTATAHPRNKFARFGFAT